MTHRIKVPGSTSNLGCGFDTFGLALNLYNEFVIEPSEFYSVDIQGEGSHLPRDENNLFLKVYRRCFEVWGDKEIPLRVLQINRVPTSRGLGSSSTAIVGGILAYRVMTGRTLSVEESLELAFEFEPHPDNLLPAMVGGFVVCATKRKKVNYVRLDFPADLRLVFAVPELELSTERAREVLRNEVELSSAVSNIQRASLFLASMFTGKYDLLRLAVEDRLHQPYRAGLIPGFYKVVEAGYSEGALAVFLSGAGPTVGSLCLEDPKSVGRAMVRAFEDEGVRARFLILEVDYHGAQAQSVNP